MEYYERTILSKVCEFMDSNSPRVAVLYGMPCVGKSVLLRRISALRGSGYILMDVATDRELRETLLSAVSEPGMDAVVRALMTFFGISEESFQNTMFLFDSAECLGERINALLQKDLPNHCLIATNRVDYIAAEMMSETTVQSVIRFFSVKPLSFSEFLNATGKGDYVSVIRAGVLENKPIPPMLRDDISEQYYEYLLVGGFPQAVFQYAAEHADISALRSTHRSIFHTIIQTYLGYELQNKDCISSIRIVQIIDYLKNHAEQFPPVFRPGSIRRGLTRNQYREELDLLVRNGLLVPIVHSAVSENAGDEIADASIVCDNASFEFILADNGLQRYLSNDYDVFFQIEDERLPLYVLYYGLYVACDINGIVPEYVSIRSKCIIPMLWRQNNCMFTFDARNSACNSKVFDYFIRKCNCKRMLITDDTSRNKETDHKIMWFELDEVLNCKKR